MNPENHFTEGMKTLGMKTSRKSFINFCKSAISSDILLLYKLRVYITVQHSENLKY